MTARDRFEKKVKDSTDWLIFDGRPFADFAVVWNGAVVAVRLGRKWKDSGRIERTGTPIAGSFEEAKRILGPAGRKQQEKLQIARADDRSPGLEQFTPDVVDDRYGTMLVELETCKHCKKKIVRGDGGWRDGNPFPHWVGVNFEAQLKRAGWRRGRKTRDDDGWICAACDAAGKDTITCALCREERPTSEIQDSLGDPPDFLCKTCFTTKPAKEWSEAVENLHEAHRYDFS